MRRSAEEIAEAVRSGACSAEEFVRASLDRIDAANPRLNACVEVFHERAIADARRVDERVRRAEGGGKRGELPLAGVPVAIKDNICLGWGRTTCGSRMLAEYRSPFTATAAQRLIDAGAVVVAKTNMDEFGMGSSTELSVHGPTRNPWDRSRTAGGSSGGSACAVAAGMVPIALGSDTGGSIRQPAGFCGVAGIKPTYGRVSRWGLVAYASSLDQIGVLGGSVRDAALALEVISGHDERDSTCAPMGPARLMETIDRPLGRGEGLRVGVPREARGAANHAAVVRAVEEVARVLSGLGAEIVDIDLPAGEHAIAAYYLIATAEASSNLARFDGVRFGRRCESPSDLEDLYARSRSEGFGPEVRRRIMLGTYALSAGYYEAYYGSAQKARTLIKRGFDEVFARGIGAVLMPTSPQPAFGLGEKTGDPLAMYLQDVYTVGANLAGLPAIAFRAMMTDDGGSALPVGVQLVGPALGEEPVARVARMYEVAAGEPRWPSV